MALNGSIATNHFSDAAVAETWMNFNWSATQKIPENYSTVDWNVKAKRGNSNWVQFYNVNLNINGDVRRLSGQYSNDATIASGSFKLEHNNAGEGSFSISISANVYYSSGGSISASETFSLNKIPRYANITSFSVSKRNETSVIFNWSVDENCDYAWYSKDNGSSWSDLPTNNIVSGLSANTSYNFKLRVRRKDSQLTTDSSTVAQTTYKAPTNALNSKTETTVEVKWTVDSTADYIWYSKDNGSNWTGVGSVDATSGTYKISGLSANTSYNIKTRVRRKAPQTTYDTSVLSVTTYDYPKVSAVGTANMTIGKSQTLTLYNPLSRNVTVKMNKDSASGTQLYSGTTTGTSITFTPTASTLYASIPSAKSGKAVYSVVYGSTSTKSTTGSYTYVCNDSECKPTYASSNISYYDSNTTVTAITGNNQHIVQNKSNLKIKCTGATAKNSATISSYSAVFNNVTKTIASGDLDFGKINLSNSASVTITVTDSRGYTASATKTITIYSYSSPTAQLTAYRKNNYEDESYFKCDASISSVNGKNTMTIKYGYAQGSTSSPTASTSIADNTQVTLTLNKNNEYRFIARVQDKFETKDFYIVLPKGVFIEFWDTQKLSVGINGFPKHEKSFEVFGDLYTEGKNDITTVSYNKPTNNSKIWIKASKNLYDNSVSAVDARISTSSGNTYPVSGWKVSGYIPVKANQVYALNTGSTAYIALYDSNFTFKTGLAPTSGKFTPTVSGYVRFDFSSTATNIQLEYNNITAYEQSFKDVEIYMLIDGVYEKLFKRFESNTYSTNEVRIGTWTDGKPLYRKTIRYTHSETIGEKNKSTDILIPHGIANLKQCYKSTMIHQSGYILPVMSSSTGTTITSMTEITQVGATAVRLRIINDTWNAATWVITLEYTKTTD